MSAASNIGLFTGLADSNMSDAMGTFLGKMNELFPMNRMATGNIQSAIIGNNPLSSNKARVYIRALPDSNDKTLFLAMFNYLVDPTRKPVAATALTALTAGSARGPPTAATPGTGTGLPLIDPLAAMTAGGATPLTMSGIAAAAGGTGLLLADPAASGGGTPAVNLAAATPGPGTGLLLAAPAAPTTRRGTPIVASAATGTGLPSAGPLPTPTTRRGTPIVASAAAAAPMPLAPAPVPPTCVPSPEQYSAVVAAATAMGRLVQAMDAARGGKKTGLMQRMNPFSSQSGGARKSRKHSGLRRRKTQRRK